jgi:hypothetical protein
MAVAHLEDRMRKRLHHELIVDPNRIYVSLPLHPGASRRAREAEANTFMDLLRRECLVTAARLEYPEIRETRPE